MIDHKCRTVYSSLQFGTSSFDKVIFLTCYHENKRKGYSSLNIFILELFGCGFLFHPICTAYPMKKNNWITVSPLILNSFFPLFPHAVRIHSFLNQIYYRSCESQILNRSYSHFYPDDRMLVNHCTHKKNKKFASEE